MTDPRFHARPTPLGTKVPSTYSTRFVRASDVAPPLDPDEPVTGITALPPQGDTIVCPACANSAPGAPCITCRSTRSVTRVVASEFWRVFRSRSTIPPGP